MADVHDILYSYSKDFRVTFDVYTPRAHFIILSKIPGLNDVTQLSHEKRIQMIQVAMETKRVLRLQNASFSIHRGSWITSKIFHVHLCTNVDEYLRHFDNLSVKSPMNDWWPSQTFVNRQWKVSKNPNHYAANVKGYPVKGYKENIDVAYVAKGVTSYSGFQVAYHQNRRRMGLVYPMSVEGDAAATCRLVDVLDRMAHDIGAKINSEGCHVVVDLTGQGFNGFRTSDKVLGYLEVSGCIFYKNCPPQHRADWLKQYNLLSEDKVYT